MSSFKKTVYLIAAMSLVFMFTFFGLFVNNQNDVCYAMGIVFMIVSYHIIIRLVVENLVDAVLDYQVDSSKSWFEDSDAEKAFYRLIGVRKWKKKLPVFDNYAFSMKKRSLEDIIGASCQAEIVHEINILASLAAVLFSIPFKVMWVFLLTSVAGAVFDLFFVIVHRYNRPRLMRAAERQRRIFFEKLAYEDAFEENADHAKTDELPIEEVTERSEISKEILEQPEITEKIEEQPEIPEETAQQPEISEETAEQSEISEETAEQPEISEETAEQSEISEETVEQPEISEKIEEQPGIPDEGESENTDTEEEQ